MGIQETDDSLSGEDSFPEVNDVKKEMNGANIMETNLAKRGLDMKQITQYSRFYEQKEPEFISQNYRMTS